MFVFSSYFICLGSLALPKRGRSSFRPRFLLFVIFFCYLFGVARVAQKGSLEFPLEFFVFHLFFFYLLGVARVAKKGSLEFPLEFVCFSVFMLFVWGRSRCPKGVARVSARVFCFFHLFFFYLLGVARVDKKGSLEFPMDFPLDFSGSLGFLWCSLFMFILYLFSIFVLGFLSLFPFLCYSSRCPLVFLFSFYVSLCLFVFS